jgi:hypothetical protein
MTIIKLVKDFKEADKATHPDTEIPDEESMNEHYASWHASCRNLYTTTALNRAKRQQEQLSTQIKKKSKRSIDGTKRDRCLFCNKETSSTDHCFQKLELTEKIRDKAVALVQ